MYKLLFFYFSATNSRMKSYESIKCSLCISNFHTLVAFVFVFNAAQNYLFHPDEIAKRYLLMEYKKYVYRCFVFYMYFYITPICRQSCSNEFFLFQRVFYAFL